MTRTRSNHPWKFATYTDFVYVCRSDTRSLSLSLNRGPPNADQPSRDCAQPFIALIPSSKKNRSVSCAPLILRTATSLTVHRKVARSATRRLCNTPPARSTLLRTLSLVQLSRARSYSPLSGRRTQTLALHRSHRDVCRFCIHVHVEFALLIASRARPPPLTKLERFQCVLRYFSVSTASFPRKLLRSSRA